MSWRLTLANRLFDQHRQESSRLVLGEFDARSIRLEQTLGQPARLTFAVDGHDAAALQTQELAHEIRAWRDDLEMCRGVIVASQDTVSEQVHTVTFTAVDPLGLLDRRWLTQPLSFAQVEQDTIAGVLLDRGSAGLTISTGVPFGLGSDLPLTLTQCDPAGNLRAPTGRLRDRTYVEGTNVLEALQNLSAVIDGFDLDCRPVPGAGFEANDELRIFYPHMGKLIDGWMLEWGSTVSSLDRTVNDDTYANYVRVIGQSEEDEPQLYGEARTPDAGDIITNPAGVWMTSLASADVTVQSTLIEQAAGELEYSILLPAYSLQMVSDAYTPDAFDLGDTIRLRIQSGRLNVDTWARVVGRTWIVGDDGQEDVEIQVARPDATFAGLFAGSDHRLKALERR